MIPIAENLTVTHPAMARAIETRDPAPLVALVRHARTVGVELLDVNLGPKGKQSFETMAFVLETLAQHWGGGLWLDTTDAQLMEQGIAL